MLMRCSCGAESVRTLVHVLSGHLDSARNPGSRLLFLIINHIHHLFSHHSLSPPLSLSQSSAMSSLTSPRKVKGEPHGDPSRPDGAAATMEKRSSPSRSNGNSKKRHEGLEGIEETDASEPGSSKRSPERVEDKPQATEKISVSEQPTSRQQPPRCCAYSDLGMAYEFLGLTHTVRRVPTVETQGE